MNNLSNKISIITGASSGIGRSTAILFSKLGSKLVLVGRDENALEETIKSCINQSKNDVIKVAGDLTSPEFCQKIVDETIKSFGRINILVNGAGIVKSGSIETMKMAEYEETMNINVTSVINLTQLCVPHLIAEKGAIVNVSSVTGTRSFPGVLAYCMSKAALDQFTKCIALELAGKGVRVNAVNPGVIVTNLHRRSGMSDENYAKFLEHSKTTHALGRPGTPDEVAKAIAFLASDDSSFTTGELFHVDGVRGVRGILVNKREIDNFQGPIPLNEYPISDDPNPRVVRRPLDESVVRARQDITIRYLEPPTPPPPGDIIIQQEKPIIPPRAPPVIIRQVPVSQSKPKEPIVIREAPPPIQPPAPRKIIKILPAKVPPPPRKLIIEKLPPIDDQPQPIIIERWLAPKQQPRRVVFDGVINAQPVKHEPVSNEIIEFEPPKVIVNKEVKDAGVVRMDPNEYYSKYRDNLVDPKNLPDYARDVRPPPGYMLASEAIANQKPAPLEGDLQALSMIDLEREGLSEYKIYVQKNPNTSTNNYTSGGYTTSSYPSSNYPTTSGGTIGNNTVSAVIGSSTNYQPPNHSSYSAPNGTGNRAGWADTGSRAVPAYEIRATTTTASSPNGDGGYYERRTTIYKSENSSL